MAAGLLVLTKPSIDAKDCYRSLTQPTWPPPTVFGPVWTELYAMMCVAAWLVVRRLGTKGSWLLPYLAWVWFASALTFAMWRLNPGVL